MLVKDHNSLKKIISISITHWWRGGVY